MSLTQEQIDAAVWGTGYGSRKHLIDHAETDALPVDRNGGRRDAKVRCTPSIYVDFLDSSGGLSDEVLEGRKPCARCQKIADAEASR